MKYLKIVALCCACFLLAAMVTCFLRTKYSLLPSVRTSLAFAYTDNVRRYSFLQYTQSDPQQGKTALLQFVNLLQRIRRENIVYPANTLHNDLALAYLRLYRIESASGNDSAADTYMRSAQKELVAEGEREQQISPEVLAKLIAARESKEATIYSHPETPSGQESSRASKEKPE